MADRDDYIEIDFGNADDGGGVQFEDTPAPAGPGFADEAGPDGASADSEAEAAPEETGEAPPASGRPREAEVMPIDEEVAAEPEGPEFDWLTEVAIPIGIFGLLGCFLYYLIDLRAALGGEFSSGLRWVCFWFLLAAILITRIRTKYGNAALAAPYVIGLAGATGVFVWHFTFAAGAMAERFTGSGLLMALFFNYALVGLVWWAAYKVTRECTLEENVEYSLSQGFLADLAGKSQGDGKEQAQGRHPGRIILWVSIVAVIVFGLGAGRLGDESRYAAHAFWCMGGYVFFALFLLALTNLSAVRMDVKGRKVSMARSLTPTWITSSLVLVLLIVALSAILPRTSSGPGSPLELGPRAAWLRDMPGGTLEGGPTAGLGQPPPEGSSAPGRHAETTGEGVPAQTGEIGQSGTGGQQGRQGARGQGGRRIVGAGPSQGAGASSGADEDQRPGGGGEERDERAGGQAESRDEQEAAQEQDREEQQDEASQDQQDKEGGEEGEGEVGAASASDSPESRQGESGMSFPWWLWLLLLLLAALIIYLLIRYRKQVMAVLRALAAPFRAMWAALLVFLERLRRLLGFKPRGPGDEFADLPEDPFADLWDQRELLSSMTAAQIVRHVYRAFLGFCSLRGHGRPEHVTEYEFLRYLPPRIGLEEGDQRSVTNAYVFATYSPNEVRAGDVEQVRDIWGRLRPAIDNALAARAAKAKGR